MTFDQIEEHRDLVAGLEYESVDAFAKCPACGSEVTDEDGAGQTVQCLTCDWEGSYEEAVYEADPDRMED